MRRDDYLIRLIRQFIETLTGIRSLRAAQQDYAALEAITKLAARLLELPDDGRLRSLREVLAYMGQAGPVTLDRDRQIALAALLVEAGSIYEAQRRLDDSYHCYLQALHRMLEVTLDGSGAALPEYAPRVERIAAALRDYSLPSGTLMRLLQYYEQAGAYGKAEDVLALLLDAEPHSREVVALGRGFYRRLLQVGDDALAAGNLPREEVEEGLARLEE